MLYQRIVIGVDFSTASLNAVRWVATRFAPRAELFLAHVISRPTTPTFLLTQQQAGLREENEEPTLYPGLSGFADLAGASRAEVVVRQGRPATELAALAHEVGADLICVGRSSRRRGAARFGATTPQRLLERTRLPVLLVPSAPRVHPMTLLAAVSDGGEGLDVLQSTAALAEHWDAHVHALHSLDARLVALPAAEPPHDTESTSPEQPFVARGVEPDARPGAESIRQLTEAWLIGQTADARMADDRVTPIAHIGDAAEAIIAHAARAHCDLIVMGRRTDSPNAGRDEGCVGSTTRLITWAAPCPVLVLGIKGVRSGHERPNTLRRARRWDELRATRSRLTGGPTGRGSLAPPGGDDAA